MNAIVGHTGFVGSNIDRFAHFDCKYNTANIAQAYGTKPELLVYAGIPAEKYLANNDPAADLARIREGFENISKINPDKLVLISTADVYRDPAGVDEATQIATDGLHAYGLHRYRLEQWVRDAYPNATIVRLPGLYGAGIKKNLIYDFINRIPFMLTQSKYQALVAEDDYIVPFYEPLPNGFYRCAYHTEDERLSLKAYFERIGFSALQFTDSRSRFQFYPLTRLWHDLQSILRNDIQLINIATEPVTAGEMYAALTGETFDNVLASEPANYDIRSRYAGLLGSATPYMLDKPFILADIRNFVATADGPQPAAVL
jgi:hypothetical protein